MDTPTNILAVTLTVGQMSELIRAAIKEEIKSIQPLKEETEYLTRLQACEKLHISLPTLTSYSKLGLIQSKRLGNRILYAEEDITSAINNIPTRKLRP